MTIERLRASLADRYRVERELGHGGMAVVYLAHDLRHDRQVAIKVLRPELAAALGHERFLREITTTANLHYPHILALYDSGDADGFLYYVMPFVEGESLRDLLDRVKQLPLDDALQVAREVADALSYAHSRGLVHRDIKPENILLESGHAVVADFGIARAITAAGTETLTQTGLAIGTPQYMSPEQASGEKDLDGRSDLYSLGCVLYEMLAGEPPYTGPSAQAIMARRLMDPVPPLRTVRESVPVHVEQAINRALAKVPADRFATVMQFAEALSRPGAAVTPARPSRSRSARIAGAGGLLAVAVLAAVLWSRRSPAPPLDPELMAVFPFRVSGTDTSHGALREGMVDFLEVKFSGGSGARVLPARTALAAWHRAVGPRGEELTENEARELARRLGAGSLVLGTIVATPGRLVIQGSLLEAGTGRIRAAAKVEGSPDSLQPLVDQLAAQLVALGAGERADRLASLTSTSLPALYAYLAGKAAHRAGQYDSALQHFDRALELDSTFARAALGYRGAVGWAAGGDGNETRSLRLAWTYRDRLSPRDRVLLNALAGSRYPSSTPFGEQLDAWQEAVRQVPDDPDVWVNLGDAYFHNGARVGVEEPLRRAAEALNRALALDTTLNVEPMIHLLQIAMIERDTTTVRRLLDRFPEDAPGNAVRRLLAAVVLGDSTMLAAARSEVDSSGDMAALLSDAQLFGFGIQEAERVVPLYLKRLRAQGETWGPLTVFSFYQNLGRPAAAAAAIAQIVPSRDTPVWPPFVAIAMALRGGGDTTAAAEAAARLAPSVDGPLVRDPAAREDQYRDICWVARWRLAHGDTRAARAGIARLAGGNGVQCDVLLEALLTAVERTADAGAALGRLEALLLAGEGGWHYNLDVARLREAQGDVAGALRAVRRRPSHYLPNFLAFALWEEGRLAALAGDREGAIKAYSHYLTLRYNPEPSMKPEVDRVRAELARLVGEQKR